MGVHIFDNCDLEQLSKTSGPVEALGIPDHGLADSSCRWYGFALEFRSRPSERDLMFLMTMDCHRLLPMNRFELAAWSLRDSFACS